MAKSNMKVFLSKGTSMDKVSCMTYRAEKSIEESLSKAFAIALSSIQMEANPTRVS
jgi:hypothetical protein